MSTPREIESEHERMRHVQAASRLNDLPRSSERLGISVWTLRKHTARANVRVVRLGRRVFLHDTEIERIFREGLPSLPGPKRKKTKAELARSDGRGSSVSLPAP